MQNDDPGYEAHEWGRTYYRPDPIVQRVDHAWFAAHPDCDQYLRLPLPGEFDGRLAAPQPRYCWMVLVTAFRDPVTGEVMMRLRKTVQVPEGQS